MPIFALTGHWASGKSTVLELLSKKGANVFSADKNVHVYYRDKSSLVYKRIVSLFPDVVGSKGISRKKLGRVVFSDRKKLAQLESIIHPVITRDLELWIKKAKGKPGIYVAEVPLLFEKRLQRYFDGVIVVSAKEETIRQRVQERAGLSGQEVSRRLALFMPIAKKIKMADFVVNNNSCLGALQKKVDLLWKKIKNNT